MIILIPPPSGTPFGKGRLYFNFSNMKIPEKIKQVTRELRNNMTSSEVILWNHIKNWNLWVSFLRQKPIYIFTDGNWLERFIIPDFICYKNKIIIEVDGSVHNLKEVYILDKVKERYLQKQWFKIIRIKNEDIKTNISTVINIIKSYI